VSVFGKGYVDRDWKAEPFASVVPEYSGEVYSRDIWQDLIKEQVKRECSPYDVFQSARLPVLNQKSLNYCWCFCLVQGVSIAIAKSGYDQSPPLHLSASYPAQLYKNFSNSGGWAMQAVSACRKYGIPTVNVFPEATLSKSKCDNDAVRLSAENHSIVQYEECESKDFATAFSALISPDPCCVTLGLSWWRHAVLGVEAVYDKHRGYGIRILNSWGSGWGDKGTQVLWEKTRKGCVADEYVVVRSAKVI